MVNNDKKKKHDYNVFSIIGWIMGGLSLLNLIDDLSPITIVGKLKKWLDAYVILVNKAGHFLFGWIKVKWMNISSQEYHILIIGFIIIAAYFRAEFKNLKKEGRSSVENFFIALITSFLYSLFVFLPALFLPSWFGLVGAIAGILLICFVYFIPSDTNREYASRKIILKELIGVSVIFLLLIILNYTIFK